jgi:methylphosphotriester-DNA--protein-cysteine methyltransferase
MTKFLKQEFDTRSLVAVIAVAGYLVVAQYHVYQRQQRIEAIMTGEIRGNKDTGIFHVPTCPQYDAIKPGNIRRFATVHEAEEANYRESGNCLDAIATRRINEEETDDRVLEPVGPMQ